MQFRPFSMIVLGLMLGYSALLHAQSAGRVLVAVGDVSALRHERAIALRSGDEVFTGDTLQVGEASNMQVRFSDEGVVALRPNTVFRIDDYTFANQADQDSSIFSLLKGGMRTITGVIGKLSRGNYAVKAPTATIGVRGTNFTVVVCDNSCFSSDGSQAPNGVYGVVTDGQIASSNKAGTMVFGKNESFYIATLNDLPRILLAPPGFLRDRLEGGAKNGGKGNTTTASASPASGSGTGSPTTTTTTANTPPVVAGVAVPAYVPNDQPAVISAGKISTSTTPTGEPVTPPTPVPTYFQYALAGAAVGNDSFGPYSQTRGGEQAIVNFSGLTPEQVKASITAAIGDPNIGHDGLLSAVLGGLTDPSAILTNAWGYTTTYTNANNLPVTETFSKQAATDVGTDVAAGNVTWGRFYFTDQTTGGSTYSDAGWEHVAAGDPVINMPTSGTFQFNWVGGTNPTDSVGNVGSVTSGGVWSVGFTTGNPTVQSVSPVTWSVNGANYSLSVPATTIVKNSVTITTPLSINAMHYGPIAVSPACSGSCSSTGSGWVTPAFTGSQAQGLVMGINTYGFSGTHPTASVQVYKR